MILVVHFQYIDGFRVIYNATYQYDAIPASQKLFPNQLEVISIYNKNTMGHNYHENKCNNDVKNLINLGLVACNRFPFHLHCKKQKGHDVTGEQIKSYVNDLILQSDHHITIAVDIVNIINDKDEYRVYKWVYDKIIDYEKEEEERKKKERNEETEGIGTEKLPTCQSAHGECGRCLIYKDKDKDEVEEDEDKDKEDNDHHY